MIMATDPTKQATNDPEREAFERRRRRRNLAVFIALMAFVILVYVMTMVRTDTASVGG